MKLDRMLSMVMTLMERDRVSARHFADKFEVSVRTIYRDAEALAQAGIPILSVPGVNGGLSIMPEYKVDKKLFTSADIANLLIGLGGVSSLLGPEGTSTLSRLESLVPGDKSSEIAHKSNQIVIDLSSWMGNRNLPATLKLIKEAQAKGRQIFFRYVDRQNARSMRTVEPHQLVYKENNWYLHAWCLERKAYRLFRLSRITGAKLLEGSFEARSIPKAVPELAAKMEARMIPVTLLIDEALKERMLDHCAPEDINPAGNGRYLARFHLVPDDFGFGILLGLGPGCECLSPVEVREELKERITKMMGRY